MSAQVVVSQAGVVTDVEGSRVNIGIIVPNIDTVMTAFNQIEVWRSDLGAGGPFIELTGAAAGPARIRTGYDGALKLAGKELEVSVAGTPVTLAFVGPDPVAAAAIANRVTAQGAGLLVGVADGLRAVLQTVQTGLDATLAVVGGAAAPVLGVAGLQAHGTAARIPLVSGQAPYSFVDPHGSPDAHYTFRWSHSGTGAKAAFCPAFRPSPTTRPSLAQYCLGYCRITDPEGAPIANRSVFVGAEAPAAHNGALVTGATGWRLTDADGYCWFTLLRGTDLTVAISGTNIVRRITVPIASDITVFDLLDPAVGTDDDAFKVQVPNLDFVARRAL